MAKKALFDYLEELEQDLGEEIELDVISLCCDYAEYDDINKVIEEYSNVFENEDMEDMEEDELIDLVREYTTVIKFNDGVIIVQF